MDWINVKIRLPEIKNGREVRVIVYCGNEKYNKFIGEMDYVSEIVRGKQVERFKWNGRLAPWSPTHWQYLPAPPQDA